MQARAREGRGIDREFLADALERLAVLGAVRARPMFGGAGLYLGGVFFGLIAGDRLYLRARPEDVPGLERAGSEPFQPFADKPSMRTYWSVTERVLGDRAELRRWGSRALEAARERARSRRTARPTRTRRTRRR